MVTIVDLHPPIMLNETNHNTICIYIYTHKNIVFLKICKCNRETCLYICVCVTQQECHIYNKMIVACSKGKATDN